MCCRPCVNYIRNVRYIYISQASQLSQLQPCHYRNVYSFLYLINLYNDKHIPQYLQFESIWLHIFHSHWLTFSSNAHRVSSNTVWSRMYENTGWFSIVIYYCVGFPQNIRFSFIYSALDIKQWLEIKYITTYCITHMEYKISGCSSLIIFNIEFRKSTNKSAQSW